MKVSDQIDRLQPWRLLPRSADGQTGAYAIFIFLPVSHPALYAFAKRLLHVNVLTRGRLVELSLDNEDVMYCKCKYRLDYKLRLLDN